MGPSKNTQKAAKAAQLSRNVRSRTRQHKPRLISDPAQSTLQLTNQLRALGLYAAPTLGDGNCLFRALADQLWGSPNDHLKLRSEICDWMEARKERYEGFVEEDRSFETHIKCMRIPGTYGGHLELSAFAHLKRRNVKVIQPGLVYVIEWSGGWGADPPISSSQTSVASSVAEEPDSEAGSNDREKRRLRRERKRELAEREIVAKKQDEAAVNDDEQTAVAYVAYHDWEHFSSVRNLSGPHTGQPFVVEKPERNLRARDESPPSPPPPSVAPSKATSKAARRGKATPRGKAKVAAPLPPEPANVPLPPSPSPSPSPFPSPSPPLSQATTSTSAMSSLAPITPSDASVVAREGRSPKRTLDETEEGLAPPVVRMTKRRKAPNFIMEVDADADDNTPSLSDASSQSSMLSSSTLSSLSPAGGDPDPPPPPPPRLTRRQRKKLGLPKPPRAVPAAAAAAGPKTRSAGKIVIPGGRYSLRSSVVEAEGEWRRNGAGRLDVRGFRELKI